RVDRNQNEIASALKQAGFEVANLSRVGGGVPDLLVSTPDGHTFLVEVKSERGKLRPNQTEFQRKWRGEIRVIRSVEDVQALDS
ncbi:MAG TPA: hypothetical protein DCM38_06780, partial [Gammaproteobacteria bacterium]|nr:hypothetical protein [Gammaproteobacteria bacterium]